MKTNDDVENSDNILRMAGITNIKARKFVCLVKHLAVTATLDSIQQMMKDRKKED